MKIVALGGLLLVAFAMPADALICTIDDVPAATLLLPYFEIDLDSHDGVQTLLSINNASATAVLAHVVIWSDLSVPVLDFNIYLTGYDVQTINLRDIIVFGNLPRTAPAAQDTGENEPDPGPTPTAISNQGAFSQDLNFPSCAGQLPPPPLPAAFITHLQRSLTGLSSDILGGRCAGRHIGDNIARGYVTVDTVNNCTLRFPGDAGYFGVSGGTGGDITNQNVLWGDYFIDDSVQNFAQGETLVHIEASPGAGVTPFNSYPAPGDPETTASGQYTFYGRYDNWTAVDNREPLSTNFAIRFITGGAFTGGTSYLVWRDSKVNQGAFPCPTPPAWFPLGQEGLVFFDEQENPEVPTSIPVSPQPPNVGLIPFPAEAQRTIVDGADLPVAAGFGWMYLNLNTTVPAAGANPPEDQTAAQAWVEAVMDASGRFSVGFDAIRLDSACVANHTVPAAPVD
jgi:hypothetical protein